jgi:hypothetical protein
MPSTAQPLTVPIVYSCLLPCETGTVKPLIVSAEVVFKRIFCGALLLATFVAGKAMGPFTGTNWARIGFHDIRSRIISPERYKGLHVFVRQ